MGSYFGGKDKGLLANLKLGLAELFLGGKRQFMRELALLLQILIIDYCLLGEAATIFGMFTSLGLCL
jgi:hypothetical protein